MRYDVTVGGAIRHVTVTRSGAAFAVTVDGNTYYVDAVRIDAHTLSLVLDNVWPLDVVIVPGPTAGLLAVTVRGTTLPAALNGRRLKGTADEAAAAATGAQGPERIVAPMPGRIVRVLAAAGAAVRARQPLVVVEAMKMENELRAVRDGVVSEVLAREGQSVEAGAPLVIIQ